MRSLLLTVALILGASQAHATGRLTKRSYTSSPVAAKAEAAFRMNRLWWIPSDYGALGARDLKIERQWQSSRTNTRYRVFFDNGGNGQWKVATVDVSVKEIKPGLFKAFHGTTGGSVRSTPPGH